jgi:hypothetical protein
MSSQVGWDNDLCMSCESRCADGQYYCSQACRLAEMEKAGSTEHQTSSQLSSSASSANSANGFYLPPAVNFSAYKSPSRGFDMGPSSSYYNSYYYPINNGAYSTQSTTSSSRQQQQQQQPRSLTPSSSRSSLASNGSQAAASISAQAASQLNNYVRSFDQVREYRRRMA